MRTQDVTNTLDLALAASGYHHVHVVHKLWLLSDNGSSYVSEDLAKWLQDKGLKHSRGVPYHPQTQGKVERWHQTLKNRILLENYFLPGDLWPRQSHSTTPRKDQTRDTRSAPLASQTARRIMQPSGEPNSLLI